jgi:hypothetical protein
VYDNDNLINAMLCIRDMIDLMYAYDKCSTNINRNCMNRFRTIVKMVACLILVSMVRPILGRIEGFHPNRFSRGWIDV